ncbi:energy-coupling factor ABC transporter ATP-binding protein [Rossellomorea sp. YZS02]|uniref:energy-coupling factor ABC transporter ATP-binding protein n=1 Tax=Rossellomorea sp. YZS02 TaxID=3097358 RepID=UPI002A0BAE65|nr:energy-coupling factor ABC transporter ATP-binding protein [Rossellomorea sp. YZS02]MDX8345846.1 energy-coupling factor ABC transporter ATP-binding protein [Rossellomorea sp. YZS02]
MKEIIKVDDVYFRYPDQEAYALKGISLTVNQGEWLAIVGHNGSGKSTLAKMLNGLHFPEKGLVTVDGITLAENSIWDIRSKLGMVFQNPDNQFVGATVEDDVAFGLENHGVPNESMVQRVNDALKSVHMEDFLDQEPHHLSGGQKQRVAIAGVVALQPSIIILDEATSMLDPKGRQEVLETVRKLKEEENLTVISITHDLEEATKADRMIVLNQGMVFKEGIPEDIFLLEDELLKLGLDSPFTIKLAGALKEAGISLSKTYFTEEELVDELCKSHFNR